LAKRLSYQPSKHFLTLLQRRLGVAFVSIGTRWCCDFTEERNKYQKRCRLFEYWINDYNNNMFWKITCMDPGNLLVKNSSLLNN